MNGRVFTFLHRWGAGALAGMIGGALVGGIALRAVLRLVSILAPAGVEHPYCGGETGNWVGKITWKGSLYFLVVSAVLGILGGVFQQAVRGWLPEDRRRAAWIYGWVGMAVFINIAISPEQVDFVMFGKPWLFVTLFFLLAFVYCAVTSWTADALMNSWPLPSTTVGRALMIPLYALAVGSTFVTLGRFLTYRPVMGGITALVMVLSVIARARSAPMEPARQRVLSRAVLGGVFGVGMVHVAVALYLLFTGPGKPPEEISQRQPPPAVWPSVTTNNTLAFAPIHDGR
jgi:hypothetical protein